MNKKIITVLLVLLCVFGFSNIYAKSLSNYINIESYEDVYKLSQDSDITLPFVKVFNNKAILDKSLSNSGVFLGNKTIELQDKLNGVQAFVTQDTVDLKGSIEYGIIIAGNVSISGNVEKDILIIAESVFITDSANISKDIIIIADKVECKGNIAGNFIARSNDININANVGKDFRAQADSIEFNDTIVGSKIYLKTNSNIDLSSKYPDATIEDMASEKTENTKTNIASVTLKIIISSCMLALFNLLIDKIFPNLFNSISKKCKEHSTFMIISGFLGIITMPVVFIILVLLSIFGLSVVTLPILIIYISLIITTILMCKFIVGSFIYEYIKEKSKVNTNFKKFLVLIGIYLCLYLICYIPQISSIIKMGMVLISTGIVLTGMLKRQKNK